MVPMCTKGMDGPHVYNRDGWSPCVQYGWMVPMCTIDRDGWSPCVQVDDGVFEHLCAKKDGNDTPTARQTQ